MEMEVKSLEELVRELPPHTHGRAREFLEYLVDEPPRQQSTVAEPGPDAEVTLREITAETVHEVCRLSNSLTPPQKYMVAPNAVSIAQAHFDDHAWFRAIYADEAPVGFMMLYDDPEIPDYFLWRLMVARPHQGKGFGRRAMELLIDHVRARPGATVLETSCEQGPGNPEGFYRKLGFVRSGKMFDDEVGLILTL